MIPRYQTDAMNRIWSDEAKFATWFEVEIAHLEAQATHAELVSSLRARAGTLDWSVFAAKVAQHELLVKHDVIAFLQALEEELGEKAQALHRGLTSSDIVDTAFALNLQKAGRHLEGQLAALICALWDQAQAGRGILCLGRTHGQAAEPTTIGIKLLSHLCELIRGHGRLVVARRQLAVGKLSGAVGIYAHTDPQVEYDALHALGLQPETIGTQVIARDRHAEFFTTLAIIAGSMERLALELRLLMHGQVQEAYEPFAQHQKGSSAMPHKKNPVLCENITGLMRLVRSYALAALENQALWHERDISHSSVERVIAPDATSLMDFALARLTGVVKGLVFDASRIGDNLAKAGDTLRSQALMAALLDTGMLRSQAYQIVQQAAFSTDGTSFKDSLQKLGIGIWLSEAELDCLLAAPSEVRWEPLLFNRAQELMTMIKARN